jgi:hypothetical protein
MTLARSRIERGAPVSARGASFRLLLGSAAAQIATTRYPQKLGDVEGVARRIATADTPWSKVCRRLGAHVKSRTIQEHACPHRVMIKSITDAQQDSDPSAFTWKSIPQGAATSVWSGFVAAADPVGGKYCEDCHVAEIIEITELALSTRTRSRVQ